MTHNAFLKVTFGLLFILTSLATGSSADGRRSISQTTITVHQDASSKGIKEAIYRLSGSKNVCIRLSGTTPIHDWTMCAIGLSGEARMLVTDDEGLTEVRALDFTLPVCNLKGEVKAMDNDAYTALKCDRYKNITFKLISATVEPKGQNAYSVSAMGNLTVAGVTRTVTLRMRSHMDADGTITFTGAEKLRMSDYNVERPSLLFGAIKAGDVMTLSYSLIFIK